MAWWLFFAATGAAFWMLLFSFSCDVVRVVTRSDEIFGKHIPHLEVRNNVLLAAFLTAVAVGWLVAPDEGD